MKSIRLTSIIFTIVVGGLASADETNRLPEGLPGLAGTAVVSVSEEAGQDSAWTIAVSLEEETWEEVLSSPSIRERWKETIAALIEKGELKLEREVNGTGVHRVRRTRMMFQMNKPDHAALCRLFDISGKELSREELVEKLAEKAMVLVSFSGQMPHHQYLRLVESDTLVVLIVPDDKVAAPVAKVPRRHEDKAKTKNLDGKNRVTGDDYILAQQKLPRIQLASAKEASDYMRGIWKIDENFLPPQSEAEEGQIYVICTGDWLVIRRYMKRGGTVQDELNRIDGFEPNRAGRKHTQLIPETSGRHECNWEFWPIDQDHLHLGTYDTVIPLQRMIQAKAEPLDSAKGGQTAESSARIAVSVLDEGHGGIYVLNADGSGKQRLTNGSRDIFPQWSPDGEQIAFLALREQDHELAAEHDLAFHWFLYAMDADGQNQRRVTKTPISMIFQWSPDGSRFVFQSSWEDKNNKGKDGTASSAIYVMKADGTQQKRLTPVENNDGFPSWSPDGKQIAFCSNRHGNKDIFVMNADGSDVRRLTSNEANDSVPTWSPDGKQIAFTSVRNSGTAYVVNADGTQESSLAVRGRPVAWSPDGRFLLIENDGQLVLSGADGRNPKELTPEGKPALDGEYSPDGKAVFYRSKVNGTWTLMSVDTERLSQKRIWSDSGKFLGFSVSPSRVSLAKDSISLSTANTHLTEFGNACRQSEKLYDDSRQQLFALIPDFLDWKRREIEVPYNSTTNAFEVRVIFTPPDGTKSHVAVLISGNRHLVQSKEVDVSEAEPIIVWGVSTIRTETEYGRYDCHLLKQAALVLEGNLADKDSLDAYLESVDFKRIGKFVSSRIEKQADITKQLQGVDLTGVKQLKLSPNGELAAGLTVLYEKDSGPESLIKIWSIKKKRLVNEFRIPGKAGEFAFHPDSSTVVAAATTGNLGHTTTVREFDLAKGAERTVGICAGDIRELSFSHDGSQLAALAALSWLDNPLEMNVVGAFAFEIKVWPVNEKGKTLSVAMPHPCGEWVEMWPSKERIHPWKGEQIEAAFLKVVPKRLRFSLDGKTLICETEAGLRTIYDSRTGVMLQHSGMASVGLFKSMLMLALHQVPKDVRLLVIEITPVEKAIRLERAADGWWRAGTDQKSGFKVDGEQFVSRVGGVETEEHILMRLGLKDDTNLAELSSFRHPLGVLKINRDETGLKFRLEEVAGGTESGETLQSGEVRWTPTVNE